MGVLSNWFKKKYRYPEHGMAGNREPEKPEYGDTPLGKAMVKALAAIDARVAAGKMSASNASGYKAKVNSLQPLIGNDEEPGLLQAAQIIGTVNRSVA